MFYYKLHETQFGILIAICDFEIKGKKLDNNGIEFFVNPRFYCDQTAGKEILKIIMESNDGNVIGNNIVDLLIKVGAISEDSVILIEGIKHAQFSII